MYYMYPYVYAFVISEIKCKVVQVTRPLDPCLYYILNFNERISVPGRFLYVLFQNSNNACRCDVMDLV